MKEKVCASRNVRTENETDKIRRAWVDEDDDDDEEMEDGDDDAVTSQQNISKTQSLTQVLR